MSTPVCLILNNIFSSAKWPESWKQEYVIPIAKITEPRTEDDLRPISLTNFFSKVAENVVVKWLIKHVGERIDSDNMVVLKGTPS